MDLASEKRALRQRMAELRRSLSREVRAAAALALVQRVPGTREFERARAVALYAALPDEVPTEAFFAAARAAGKRLLLPRCLPDDRLEFAVVERWEELARGRYGVLEPPPGAAPLGPGPEDLALVPGVAFDVRGVRLGRGQGCYDRTFPPGAGVGPELFGVAYDFQLLDCVPAGDGDRRVDAVVTERRIVRTRGGETTR